MFTQRSEISWGFRLFPIWLFGVSTVAWIVIILRPARTYFGLTPESVTALLLASMLFSAGLSVAFFFFPEHFAVRAIYYLAVKSRWFLMWLGIYGLLEYYLRLPVLYLENQNLRLNLTALFSLRGGGPLLLAIPFFIVLWLAQPMQNPFPTRWFQQKWQAFLAQAERIDGKWSALLPALLPIGLVLFVIYGVWGARLSDYLPINWNDATGYWLWIRQFSFYGLGGGYNFPNELMPPAGFNHFGEGSPLYIYVYGWFGKLLGWAPHLPLLVNFGLIFVSVYGFSRWAQLDTPQNLALALLMAVAWPVMIFSATTSHESLNQAIGMVFAGIFLYLRQAERVPLASAVAIALFAFGAGMLRLSWVILFLPLFFYLLHGNVWWRKAGSILISALLAAIILYLTSLLVPPVNNSIFAALSSEDGVLAGLKMQILAQIKKMVFKQTMIPGIAILFLMALLLAHSLKETVWLLRQRKSLDELAKSQAAFDNYNVLTLFMAGLTLYLVNGFYRVFFAPLLTSLLMRVAQKKYDAIWSMVFFSLLLAPVILTGQGDWQSAKTNFTNHPPELAVWQAALSDHVMYDAQTTNPWCNTVLVTLRSYDSRLTALPPGIGVSYVLSYPLPDTRIRSKYLWLVEKDMRELSQEINLRLEPLLTLPESTLYRNLDANCSP
ncbi:MAG: hypothetical protein DDG60_02695 [Anaerolineae bacterium]|nr:MAG: hypothetical protein DDG60_02695 [Anaerolineae bacterium]